MKLKSKCCKKFQRKAKACKQCPVMAVLTKAKREKRLLKVRKKLRKAS